MVKGVGTKRLGKGRVNILSFNLIEGKLKEFQGVV